MSRRNSRHETFCREYIIDLNGTRAAIAAGYSKRTAHAAACRLLSNVKVKKLLAQLTRKHADKLDLSAEKVLAELAKMGFSNMLDYVTVENGDVYIALANMTREQAAAIQEITVDSYIKGRGDEGREVKRTRFKLASKIDALALLGKYLKLFTEKIEVTGLEHLSERMDEARRRANEKG